jgi:hypothetical protein
MKNYQTLLLIKMTILIKKQKNITRKKKDVGIEILTRAFFQGTEILIRFLKRLGIGKSIQSFLVYRKNTHKCEIRKKKKIQNKKCFDLI